MLPCSTNGTKKPKKKTDSVDTEQLSRHLIDCKLYLSHLLSDIIKNCTFNYV